jgi:hypothetical protein
METILIILICATAVWVLYRRIRKTVKTGRSGCGCGLCEGCPAGTLLDGKGVSKTHSEWKETK